MQKVFGQSGTFLAWLVNHQGIGQQEQKEKNVKKRSSSFYLDEKVLKVKKLGLMGIKSSLFLRYNLKLMD